MDPESGSGSEDESIRMDYPPNIPIPQNIPPETPVESDDSDEEMKSMFNIMTPHHVPGKYKVKNYPPLEASFTGKKSVTKKTDSFEILTMGVDNQEQLDNKDENQKIMDANDFPDAAISDEKNQVSNPCNVEDISLVTLEPKEELVKDNLVGRTDLEPVRDVRDRETLVENCTVKMEIEKDANENQKQRDDEIQDIEHSEQNPSNDDSEPQLDNSKSNLEIENDYAHHHDKGQNTAKSESKCEGVGDENEINNDKEATNEKEISYNDDRISTERDCEEADSSSNALSRNGDLSLDSAMDIKESENQTELENQTEKGETNSVESKVKPSLDTILVTDSMMADISMYRPIVDSSSIDFSIIVKTESMYKMGTTESNDKDVDKSTKDLANMEKDVPMETNYGLETINVNTETEGSLRETNENCSESEDDEFESADEGENQDDNLNKGKNNLEGSVIVLHDNDSEDESNKFKTSFSGLTGPKLQRDFISNATHENDEKSSRQEIIDDNQGVPKSDIENKSSAGNSDHDITANPVDLFNTRANSSSSIIILDSYVGGQYNSISSSLPDENLSGSVVISDDKECLKTASNPRENTGRANVQENFNSLTVHQNDFHAGEQEEYFTSLQIEKDPDKMAIDENDEELDTANENEPLIKEDTHPLFPPKFVVLYEPRETEELSTEQVKTDQVSKFKDRNNEFDTPNQNEPFTIENVPPPVPPKSIAVYESMESEKLSTKQPQIPPKDYPSLKSGQSMESVAHSFNQPVSVQNPVPTPEMVHQDYQNDPSYFNTGYQQPQPGQQYSTQQQFPPYFLPYTNQSLTAEQQQQQYSMLMYYWQMAHQFQQYNQAMPSAPPQSEYTSFPGGQDGAAAYQGHPSWQQSDGQQPSNINTTGNTSPNQPHASLGHGHLPQHTHQHSVKNEKPAHSRQLGDEKHTNIGRKSYTEPEVKKTERKHVSEAPKMSSRSNTNVRAPERPDRAKVDVKNERESKTTDSKRGTSLKDTRKQTGDETRKETRPKSDTNIPVPAPRKKLTHNVPRDGQRDSAKPTRDESKVKPTQERKKEKPAEPEKAEWYLLVMDLKQNASLENLINYLEIGLEETQHVVAEKVVLDQDNGRAVVVFSDKPDTDKLFNKLRNRPFEGVRLTGKEIGTPTHIAFSCEEPIRNPENLENYFEIPRNGGGDITVSVKESEDGSCYIIGFDDPKVVERLCTRPEPHKFDNKVLRVTPCYTFEGGAIWDHKTHTIPEADPVEITPHPEYLRYLKRCCDEDLKTQVEDKNGQIEIFSTCVKITCTLTPKLSGFKNLIRAWPDDMRMLVDKYIEENINQRIVSLDHEIEVWTRLLSSVCLTDEADLNIMQNHDNCELLFTGHPAKVDKKHTETTEKVAAIRRELRRTLRRKTYKAPMLAVVEAVGGIDKIRNELDDTIITLESETVSVEGQIEDINEVYSKIYEQIDALVCEDSLSHKYSSDCVDFIKNHVDIVQMINDAIEAEGMTAQWDLKGKELVIYYPRDQDSNEISKLVFGKIAECKIDLDREMTAALHTDEWMEFSQDQTETFTDVRHEHVHKVMVVYGYAESVTLAVKNIQTFLEENAVRSVTIKVDQVKVEFMERYKHESKKILEIEKKNEQYNVCIQLKEAQSSIEVLGKKKGREAAKRELEKVANEITSEKYEIKKIGVQEVFANEKQKGTIRTIEKDTCCLVKSPFDEASTPVFSSRFSFTDNYSTEGGATGGYDSTEEAEEGLENPTDNRTYKCKNGITITQVEGEIGRESADVLVATCDRNLDLKLGGASRSLLTCAGAELQTELSNNHQEIGHGELVKLESYRLECSKVFLTSLPNWSQNGGCMQLVQKFMTECLKALAAMRKRSIIFTAMGTGQLNFPAGQVAQVMYQTVIDFDDNSPNTSVEEVEFIMYHKDSGTIRAFKEELKVLKEGGHIQQSYVIQMTNIHVEIVIEDIAAQKVDAILCSSSDNFDLSKSGAASALFKAGGKALQDGANTFKQTGLSKGQVGKIASVGNLPCKAVFLTVLPSYSQENASALSDSIKAFLNSCHMEKMTSVAMPAMGSGFLKYPKLFVSRTMFETVQQWATNTPNSTIKSVKFVMYAKDYEVIDAFKAKIKSLQGSSTRKGRQLERSTPKEGESSKKYSMFASGCNIGHISLTVKLADIVTEKADAIVSSLGKPCEFLGAVAQSLLNKCPNMKKAVEKKKSRLEKNGLISTDSDRGIPARTVIHIHFQEKLDDWQKYFFKCLEKANDKKLKSLAFPVLGTGQGSKQFPPQDIAGALFDAINEFVFKHKPRLLRLKDVRLVIFHKQQAMKDPIMKALSQKVESSKASKGFFGKMKGVLTGMKDKILGSQKQPVLQARVDEASHVVVTIYSNSQANIDDCKKELDKRLDANYIKKKIDTYVEVVKELSNEELNSIENTPGYINITIDKPQGIITLYGPSRTVSNVDSDIQRKLMKIERDKRTAKEAKTLYEIVKWHHEDITQTAINLIPYGEAVNLTIENAYKDNKPSVRLQDTNGDVYIIDFAKMVEYPEVDRSDEVNVIRKDIIKGGDANLPKEWVPMADNENIKVVNLMATDQEYKTVESTFVKGAQTGSFSNRIPNVAGLKVTKIERIQNKTLYQQYTAKKKQMQGDKPQLPANMPLERTLWHGTAQGAVGSIQRNGFNRSYCGKNGIWFGAGVYFAADASYSARPWLAIGQQNPPLPAGQNKGYIFMCKVLTGEYTLGKRDMRYLPAVNPAKSKTLMFDSAVDNLANPVEFVIFHDTQAYPEYIITFTL